MLQIQNIDNILNSTPKPSREDVERVLAKGTCKQGLTLEEVFALIGADQPDQIANIRSVASKIKEEIYGERLVLFAPLYISDHCVNDCAYCGFHATNGERVRRKLSMEEVSAETKCLIDMGHKRVLVEFGEDPERNTIDYVCEAIRTIYKVKSGNGNIRRVNVNVAATTVENYRRLKDENIGTYQLFQETYHRATYEAVHKGPKGDHNRQLTAHDRAREAGLDDLGIGVLFGLYDWRFEILAMLSHAQYMERELGIGPHTISVPRLRTAAGTKFDAKFKVSDEDFLKLIAILRIAVPYTGLILSTRESPATRKRAFKLGISQASASSATNPGGYLSKASSATTEDSVVAKLALLNDTSGQFQVQDERSVDEVISSVIDDGLIPSFCTACYRTGRTGEKFMNIAKPGEIHNFCRPNALLTFAEYLEDFGDAEIRKKGNVLIEKYFDKIENNDLKQETSKRLLDIKKGRRDLFF